MALRMVERRWAITKVVRSRISSSSAAQTLISVVASSALAVVDRTSVLTLGQVIKHDLAISDAQFGLISGFAISVFYALFGLPLEIGRAHV